MTRSVTIAIPSLRSLQHPEFRKSRTKSTLGLRPSGCFRVMHLFIAVFDMKSGDFVIIAIKMNFLLLIFYEIYRGRSPINQLLVRVLVGECLRHNDIALCAVIFTQSVREIVLADSEIAAKPQLRKIQIIHMSF